MQKQFFFVSNPYLVCRVKESLYGLKQAPRANAKIDGFLLSLSFVQCKSDPNVYLKLIHGSLMIIFLYVDDLLITGCNEPCIFYDRFGAVEPILGSQNCSIQTWNQGSSVKVCF